MSIFLKEHYGHNSLSPKQILKDPILFLAFGFGSGLIKFMPGTFGSIAALPIYLALQQTSPLVYLIVTVFCILSGIWICEQGAKKLAVHDFGGIVWDEIAGMLISLYGLPCNWQTVIAGFVLFRFFDILKPWPIKWLDQHINGGIGIMLDDVVAGLFAALTLRIWF